ncbi:MAG TPA: hypothetical protein P5257_05095 [Bacteroidales bacterium]|nr:hypothetical protein [Bacteroidales bacterium]
MKRIFIIAAVALLSPYFTTRGQETAIRREVTLYNPYKPSLPDVVKKSFLPDMTDTARITPVISYSINTNPYTPPYTVSPLRPATMVPDPLNKLYNSYIRAGFGNYLSPLGEVSITNQRSRKGMAGFYAGHYSSGGKVRLDNGDKGLAGYMDNNASLYGKKFLNESLLYGSADFSQNVRYAYGYDTSFTDYNPSGKDIRLNYISAGATAGIASFVRDSSDISYKAEAGYNFFSSGSSRYENNLHVSGEASGMIKGFYAGAGLEYRYFKPASDISPSGIWILSLSPYLKKKTEDWDVRLGASFLLDRELNETAKLKLYPDFRFSFNILPSYLRFYAELTGKLQTNRPEEIIRINPFLDPDTILYMIKSTSTPIALAAGFTGETGLDGFYRVYASYTVSDNMVLFSNFVSFDSLLVYSGRGNYFIPVYDDAEILSLNGETGGKINNHLKFNLNASWFRYTLSNNASAWGLPDWKAGLKLEYNLRNKIIADLRINATGSRQALQTYRNLEDLLTTTRVISLPANLTLGLGAEYRYTKILSFWVKFNNISFSKYYEWAWYPSQRFNFMAGFTYSL